MGPITLILALTFVSVLASGSRAQSVPSPSTKPAIWTNSVNMTFVLVPAGEFVMGSPPTERDRFDNEAAHRVKITKPFLLGTTHVTVAQFAEFVKQSGYATAAE